MIRTKLVLGEPMTRQHSLPLGLRAAVGREQRRIAHRFQMLVEQHRTGSKCANADGVDGRRIDAGERFTDRAHDAGLPIPRRGLACLSSIE